MFFASQRTGGFGVVELADRFGRVFEGGIGTADYDLGNNGSDFLRTTALDKGIIDSLGEPVADLALAHGDGGLERHGGRGGAGSGFFVN